MTPVMATIPVPDAAAATEPATGTGVCCLMRATAPATLTGSGVAMPVMPVIET